LTAPTESETVAAFQPEKSVLWRKVGASCATAADEQMRNLDCQRIQCDEIWTFCRMKQAYIPRFTDRTKVGDQWTFVAIDPDTKLIPAYRVGKRTRETAVAFMTDLFRTAQQSGSDFVGLAADLCGRSRARFRRGCGLRADC